MTKKKKNNKFFYLVLILIPILFFGVLELSLQLFNYGVDTSTWLKITDKYYGLNPDVAKRYFNSVDAVPESIQDVFLINKKPNSYRIFVLGGSSAAGYPFMPLGSFSRYLRQRLEQNYPQTNIEVVNISLTAINSYTIRDLISDVLDKQPDLILIYAGHNEYYGALGIGSMESLGKSRSMVNLVLNLNKFKTTQLLRDIIKSIISSFTSEKKTAGTLMSKMAENQKIEYGSEIFESGIEQFEGNLTDVIKLVQNENVPIILSTIVSNLKDQPPFISDKNNIEKNANLIYAQASKEYELSDFNKADSMFRLAKDYDLLRFRGPEKINETIKNFESRFNIPVVQTDSILSVNNIIGNNLMIDHLHLTVAGYQDIGELFYEKMDQLKLLPEHSPKFEYSVQDSITRKNFIFSEFDSITAYYKIKLLKNDWPFIPPNKKKNVFSIIKPTTFVDSLAFNFVLGKEEWERAHRKLAAHYLKKGNFEKVLDEYDLLIHQFPMIINYHTFLANQLMKRARYSEALTYLEKGYNLRPDAFFTKWLGIINLANEKVDSAIYFLETSLYYNSIDTQVLFNLSGAYSKKKEFKKALETVNKCLSIKPNYKSAQDLQAQLKTIVK